MRCLSPSTINALIEEDLDGADEEKRRQLGHIRGCARCQRELAILAVKLLDSREPRRAESDPPVERSWLD